MQAKERASYRTPSTARLVLDLGFKIRIPISLGVRQLFRSLFSCHILLLFPVQFPVLMIMPAAEEEMKLRGVVGKLRR